MDVDGESAEAVADILQRYGHQGVAIEQGGFEIETWEDEVPPTDKLIVRAYIPDDERAADAKAQLEESLFQLYCSRSKRIRLPRKNTARQR